MTRDGKNRSASSGANGALTCLRDDYSFQLTLREAFPRHLGVPSFVKMRSALEYPSQAEYHIADREDKDRRV